MNIRETVTVDAPVQRVFGVFADLEHAATRLSGVVRVEVLEGAGNPLAVGTCWRETRVMFGKEATEEMWITAVDAPHGYTAAAESCGTRYRSEYTFSPGSSSPGSDGLEREAATTTEVTMVFEGTPVTWGAKLMSPLGWLFGGTVRKMLRQDLEDLKAVCEEAGA